LLVLHSALVLVVAALSVSVDAGDVLEIAFTTLVTDRAVQRVIGQKEFHDTTSSNARLL